MSHAVTLLLKALVAIEPDPPPEMLARWSGGDPSDAIVEAEIEGWVDRADAGRIAGRPRDHLRPTTPPGCDDQDHDDLRGIAASDSRTPRRSALRTDSLDS